MHFWTVMGVTYNKHCFEAFIQIKWVLFPVAMNRCTGYNPICCPTISVELRYFEIPCQVGDKVACRACARNPDVTIPSMFVLPNFRGELCSRRTLVRWVSVSRMRHRCAQPGWKQLRCDSKTISNLNACWVMAQTSSVLTDTRADGHTHKRTQTQATTIHEDQNWPLVKINSFDNDIVLHYLKVTLRVQFWYSHFINL